MTLSPTQRRQWDDEGYLMLRQIIPFATITAMRALYERVSDDLLAQLEAEGLITADYKQLPFERRFAAAGKHANRFGRGWRRLIGKREVFELQLTPTLVDVIGELTGTDVIGHPVFNARPKLPGQQLTVVPWHQDSSYFGAASERSCIVSVWVPLVPVDESNGCMQIIPGTHRQPLHPHRTEDREGQFLELEDALIDESRAVTLPMQPGDALLFTNLTYHRSLPSKSPDIRWSIDIRYVRDGDFPGAPNVYWPDPNFNWVIRSSSKPATSLEDWEREIAKLQW